MSEPTYEPESIGTWAKRYYYANRAAVDAVLPGGEHVLSCGASSLALVVG